MHQILFKSYSIQSNKSRGFVENEIHVIKKVKDFSWKIKCYNLYLSVIIKGIFIESGINILNSPYFVSCKFNSFFFLSKIKF